MKKMILEGVRTGSGHAMLGVWLTIATLFAPQGVTLGQESGTPPAEQTVPSDFVTINVDNGGIEQVLNAFSRQTGKSIVIGPEVTSKVTVRLKHIRWDEALSTILKPYGYDYYLTGETIVVCSQDKLPGNAAGKTAATGQASATPVIPAEPLVTRVFTLKYLDASDVEEIIKAQLSPAGKASKLFIRSQSWKADSSMGGGAGAGGSGGSSAGAMGRLRRVAEENVLVKGKTIVVTDTATVIAGVEAMLTEVDRMPVQVLIEAKFIEVQSDLLRDIGLEFGTGATGAETPGVQAVKSTDGKNLFAAGVQQIGGTAIPANFLPQGALSSTRPFIGGLSVAFEQLTGVQFQVLLHLLEEDASFNILSSPRILTLNNQDATIIVGTKYPIIKSESNSGGLTATTSTSLEYYENVGIQLNVLPQVCGANYINLIVHPSVREQIGTQSGTVSTGVGVNLTPYPVLTTREAETQILVQSGRTIVIGGLLKDRKSTTMFKVPYLGNIPLLGRLFRRETTLNEKIDLLIFLTATIKSPGDEASYEPQPPAKPGAEEKKAEHGSDEP